MPSQLRAVSHSGKNLVVQGPTADGSKTISRFALVETEDREDGPHSRPCLPYMPTFATQLEDDRLGTTHSESRGASNLAQPVYRRPTLSKRTGFRRPGSSPFRCHPHNGRTFRVSKSDRIPFRKRRFKQGNGPIMSVQGAGVTTENITLHKTRTISSSEVLRTHNI